jgi:hypothetical protein
MKKRLIACLIVCWVILSAGLLSQEIIKPKTKKIYVSEQQDIELDGEMIVAATEMSGVLISLSHTVFLIIKAAITRVNNYACGQKECLNKVERTDRHAQKVKIKEKIDACIRQIDQMIISLNSLIESSMAELSDD